MSKNVTKIVNIGINGGWLSGSTANQLNRKIQKNIDGTGESWGVVQIIPNSRNVFILGLYALLSVITLGFVVPSAGYAVVLEKVTQ